MTMVSRLPQHANLSRRNRAGHSCHAERLGIDTLAAELVDFARRSVRARDGGGLDPVRKHRSWCSTPAEVELFNNGARRNNLWFNGQMGHVRADLSLRRATHTSVDAVVERRPQIWGPEFLVTRGLPMPGVRATMLDVSGRRTAGRRFRPASMLTRRTMTRSRTIRRRCNSARPQPHTSVTSAVTTRTDSSNGWKSACGP